MTNMTSTCSKRVIIRFLTINDVYELDNLPRFATAVREVRQQLQCQECVSRGEARGEGEGNEWGDSTWISGWKDRMYALVL